MAQYTFDANALANSAVSAATIANGSISCASIDDYSIGGYIKGGKSVASKDDVVKAIYRLNPTLKDKFEDQEEFVDALVAAGTAAHQRDSMFRLSDINFRDNN
jgi:phage terminase small subunit